MKSFRLSKLKYNLNENFHKRRKQNTIEMKIIFQNTIEIQSKLNLKNRNRNTNIKSEMDSIK